MKNKVVIGDKVYDVEKSKLIFKGTIDGVKPIYLTLFDRYGYFPFTGTLYKTKKGNWFMVNETEAITVDEVAVKEHFKKNDYEKYCELFGELEEA